MKIQLEYNDAGFLINPNFKNLRSQYGLSTDDSTLWLHSTNAKNVEDFVVLDPNYKSSFSYGSRFYIGAGGNTNFGNHCVFVKYEPTKLFNGTDPEHIDSVIDLILDKLYLKNVRHRIKRLFIELDEGNVLRSVELQDFDRTIVKKYLKRELESLGYIIYENQYVTAALKEAGYTGYLEAESSIVHLNPYNLEWLNICIFGEDFDNVILDNYYLNCHDNMGDWSFINKINPLETATPNYPYGKKISEEGYLLNPSTGTDLWYHITEQPLCDLKPWQGIYLMMNKQYLLESAGSIIGHRSDTGTLCTVRIKGVSWSEIFDLGDYHYIDNGKLKLTPKGEEFAKVAEAHNPNWGGMPESYYYCEYEMGFSKMLISMLEFKGFLEDENDFLLEDNPENFFPEGLWVISDIEVVKSEPIVSDYYGEYQIKK